MIIFKQNYLEPLPESSFCFTNHLLRIKKVYKHPALITSTVSIYRLVYQLALCYQIWLKLFSNLRNVNKLIQLVIELMSHEVMTNINH